MKEGSSLQYITKIDKRLFKEISVNVTTNEVVLTNKQREHIEERHPNILEKYEKYFSEIIEKPDYILKDNARENTALILKRIKGKDIDSEITINLVLRLAVIGDDENNKNSIITCIPIGKSRLKTYIKNGKIIYKRE